MNNNKKKIETEIDFKNVIKNPLRWFGLIYVLIFIVIFIGGNYWIDNLSTIAKSKVPPIIEKSWPTELEQKPGQKQEGVDVQKVSQANDEMISRGKELYDQNCASCHGETGKGDGPAGAALDPPPRNFLNEDGWVNGRRIFDMYKTIEEGIIENGMAAYAYMPVKDKFAMIHYIRTFAGHYPKPTEDELAQLDLEYNLSEGTNIPPQIPISRAINILDEENLGDKASTEVMLVYMKEDKDEKGYKLFDKYTKDKSRSLMTLYKTNIWRDNLNNFINIISSTITVNGFKTEIMNLKDEEWKTLQSYLSQYFKDVQT